MTHEEVVAALFSWLQGQTTAFKTLSRRAQFLNKVAAQPALFLRHVGVTDDYQNGRRSLGMQTLECQVWIASKSGENPNLAPDIDLNNLVTQVRNCFAPDEDDRFTLAGLVYWARIEGQSTYYPGDLNGQALAVIPVRITLPAGGY